LLNVSGWLTGIIESYQKRLPILFSDVHVQFDHNLCYPSDYRMFGNIPQVCHPCQRTTHHVWSNLSICLGILRGLRFRRWCINPTSWSSSICVSSTYGLSSSGLGNGWGVFDSISHRHLNKQIRHSPWYWFAQEL